MLERAQRYRADVNRYAAEAAEQAQIASAYANIAGGNYGHTPAAPGPVAGMQCRACGAPTQFAAGEAHSHCVYCGASLFAAAETQARGLDEAARAFRGARLDALRSERHFAVQLAKTYRNTARYKRALLVALPVAATVAVSLSQEPERELGVLAGVGATIAGVLIGIALAHSRRTALARAEAAVLSVARAPTGHLLAGTRAVADWLDTYWWDEYRAYDLAFPYESRAAAGRLRGLPVLAVAAPLSVNGSPFLDVLVSAWYDGRSERGEGPAAKGDAEVRRALHAQGFTLRSGPSGIHARLTDDPGGRLKAGIDLGTVAEHVAKLAVSQGGRAPAV